MPYIFIAIISLLLFTIYKMKSHYSYLEDLDYSHEMLHHTHQKLIDIQNQKMKLLEQLVEKLEKKSPSTDIINKELDQLTSFERDVTDDSIWKPKKQYD